MKWIVIAVTITALAVLTPSGGDASVPGKAFTETGCEEYSDSVARLYTAGLGREPEQGGFEFWMTEYTSGRWLLPKMATFFTQSPEFERSYGTLTQDGFIRQLYRNVLGREGEQGGVTFWNQQMSAGMDRGTVLLRFAESPENIDRSGTSQPALGPFNAGLTGSWTCAGWAPTPLVPVATTTQPTTTQPTTTQPTTTQPTTTQPTTTQPTTTQPTTTQPTTTTTWWYPPPPASGWDADCHFDGVPMWGSVYVSSSSIFADFTVYESSSSIFADLDVYSTSSPIFASSCGRWYFTSSSIFADFTVYFTSSPIFADFDIYFTSSSIFAGR